MNYSKPRGKKLYKEIAEIIEKEIMSKNLLPGDQLDSVELLSKNFEVSRSVTREALTILQAKGMIEIRQGEGTFVRPQTLKDIKLSVPDYVTFSKEDLLHIFEVRKIIEIGLIESAVVHITEKQLSELQNLLYIMEKSLLDTEQSSAADTQFHTLIAEAAHNPLLVSMLKSVSSPISKQIKQTRALLLHSNKQALSKLHKEHIKIYEALEKRNVTLASNAIKNHLNTVKSLFF